MNLGHNPSWNEAMFRAAQARRLAVGAETLRSKLHLKSVALMFLARAAEVRRRDHRSGVI